MNKSDLIEALAAKEKLTDKKATEIIKLIFDGFTETIKNNGRIEIRGFGSFSVREYEPYTGRNPKTGSNKEQEWNTFLVVHALKNKGLL